MKCLSPDNPSNQWGHLCPSIAPAYLFAILFGLTTIVHIIQGILYKKFYSLVIAMSALWQTLAFIFRVLSIRDQKNETWYIIWFIIILVAPLWTNAYVYMIMGRLVHNFYPKGKTIGIPAHRFGLYFVLLDIFSFFVQIGGASIASGDSISTHQMLLGIHIYMGGIGIQQVFILLFLALSVRFHRAIHESTSIPNIIQVKHLLYTIYAVLILITIRIIFRLIEYSNGIKSSIPSKEAFMYCFDSLPMLIALVLLNVIHPGRIMPGKEYDLPSRKQRKLEAKHNKEASSLENGNVMTVEEDNSKTT